ncbi:hypothetical protein CLV48_1179 [Cecembia rubra]|uniref:Uncharacterized protein n=1 Tax=Cecembia rubra TaxID=1485585 RepID=A0A2P8DPU2_9BACT|nr:hypothetical protein CLV48_1179 [Cecembia rubra]
MVPWEFERTNLLPYFWPDDWFLKLAILYKYKRGVEISLFYWAPILIFALKLKIHGNY